MQQTENAIMIPFLFTRRFLQSQQRRLLSSAARWQISPDKRSNLIFGANTDVGKTLVSAGLVRASLQHNPVTYLKPLQCGHSDQEFVKKYTSGLSSNLSLRTLFEWDTPASPHAASRLENKPVADEQVKHAVQQVLAKQTAGTTLYMETAGGVLSPSSASPDNASATAGKWGWQTQADLYQAFNLPVVLVGDGRLGGISATLAALEVLLIRGYDIAAIVVIDQEDGMDNVGALRDYCERGLRSGSGEPMLPTPSQSIVSLPPIPVDKSIPLFDWYASVEDEFQRLDGYLQKTHEGQIADWQALPKKAKSVLWWPSTKSEDVRLVDSASGEDQHVLKVAAGGGFETCSQLDASDETRGLGHGDSTLALAGAAASGRYGNLWYPGTVHAPAVSLAQRLAQIAAGDRVLFSQDPPVETALYMGMKTYQERQNMENPQDYQWAVCSQEGCHHGYTLAAMNVGEPQTAYLEDQHPWYESKSLLVEPPTLGYQDGILSINCPEAFDPEDDEDYHFDSIEDAMDVTGRLLSNRRLHSVYKERIEMHWLVDEHKMQRKIASLILEPIWSRQSFVDPLWQRAFVEVAKSRNIPVIFDEIRSGLHRVGVSSCREILQIDPDITCLGNHLSGGTVPLNAVVATQEVFDAFDEEEGLLCGGDFAGHPVGCVSALRALDAYSSVTQGTEEQKTRPPIRMLFDEDQVKQLSQLSLVEESFSLGAVLVVTIQEDEEDECHKTKLIMKRLGETGVVARSEGKTIQFVFSPLTSKNVCAQALHALKKAIQSVAD